MNQGKKILKFCSAICLTGAAAFFCYYAFSLSSEHSHSHHHHDHEDEEEHSDEMVSFSDDQTKKYGVLIQKASGGNLKKTINSPGLITTNGDVHIHLLPKVSGIVAQATKNIGDQVKENELLAVLESREMAEAKSAYLEALKKEMLTAKKLARESSLFEKKVSTEMEYQEAQAAQEDSLINLELAKQKLFTLGLTSSEIDEVVLSDPQYLRIYEMRSPLNGTVIKRHLANGEYIDIAHEAYEIADLQNVWVEFALFPNDISLIRKGQIVKFKDALGRTGSGEIIHISPTLEENTRKAFAIAQVDNQTGIWNPGLFVDVQIPTEEKKISLMIPKEAVQKVDGKQCLFVQNNEGFEVRPVILGDCNDSHIEVLSGLKPGERYASEKTFILKAELKKHEAEHMD